MIVRTPIVLSLEDMYLLFNAAVDREDYERAGAFLDAVLGLNDEHEQQADADA
jgi:hypothetical protein